AVLLEVAPDLNTDWLQLALNHLVSHHDALRMRFDRSNSSWKQFNLETVEDISLTVVDDFKGKFVRAIGNTAEQLQASLDITQGKLIAGALFRSGDGKSDRLLLIIHHLVVDGVSWRIILEDIATAYQQLQDSQSLQLPPKTTSYKYWGEALEQYAKQIDIAELDYWLNKQITTSIPIDKSSEDNTNTIAYIQEVSVSLDTVNTSSLLTKVSQTYNTRIDDILLTALIQSFYLWTNSKELLFDLENYGREQIADDIDITRTVGWFTAIYPVQLKIDSVNHLGETIKSVKEQLRAYQNKGFNYGIIKHINSESSQQIQQLPSSQIAFNYLGQLKPPPAESIIKGLAKEPTGNTRNLLSKRRYLIEINAVIADNKLEINWVYSQNYHQRSTITKLANNYLKSLTAIIKHCLSPTTGGSTPSDFSAAKVNQNQLDKLMGQINKNKF
ncbi:MAG: condensation domain-containing protein, partial [Pleurocapsa sp.]